MLDLIETHIMDLLAASATLYAGGTAYAAGWSGVKRPDNGTDVATAGYVNVYDGAFEPAGQDHRPAIYLGSEKMEASDSLDFAVCASGQYQEYRKAIVPLVVVAQAASKLAARRQRNQLRYNVELIMMSHIMESGYWWQLERPGQSGGGMALEHSWMNAQGSGAQMVVTAFVSVPYVLHYLWTGSTANA